MERKRNVLFPEVPEAVGLRGASLRAGRGSMGGSRTSDSRTLGACFCFLWDDSAKLPLFPQ